MKINPFLFLLILVLGSAVTVWGQTQTFELAECRDDDFQVNILCDPGWQVIKKPRQTTLVIKDREEESVTLTFSQNPEPGVLFEDLTPSALQRVYHYQDHFVYAKIVLAGEWAVRVEAGSAKEPNTRFLDYFYVKGNSLFRLSFSVSPPERYDMYRPLFEAMMKHFYWSAGKS